MLHTVLRTGLGLRLLLEFELTRRWVELHIQLGQEQGQVVGQEQGQVVGQELGQVVGQDLGQELGQGAKDAHTHIHSKIMNLYN